MIETKQARAIRIEHNGEALSFRQWSERYGISSDTLRQRLLLGWTMDAALSRPVRKITKRAAVMEKAGQLAFFVECSTGRKVAR